ncbi:MAG: hypothetical protein LBT89_12515 [Planctomycetaceae bacterium]|jgi:hypothetical protein|nr:hypothetical protein [Planctomycetaceae bacterium]
MTIVIFIMWLSIIIVTAYLIALSKKIGADIRKEDTDDDDGFDGDDLDEIVKRCKGENDER